MAKQELLQEKLPPKMEDVDNTAKKGKGLSELARQLRVMQAKNQKLSAEIGRLERQLRIVAETSGVSVNDLRGTLQRACESEAYGELQSRLASLQAQLEETQLKQRKAADFDREAEAKKTANLELRIGELEEVESALRQEIGLLYKSQDSQGEEAAKLKATNDSQAKEIEALHAQLHEMETELKQRNEKEPTPVIPVQAPKTKDPPAGQSDQLKKPPPSARKPPPTASPDAKAQTHQAAKNSQVQLLRNQVAARGKELELKESQYKTRFALQEERIVDMEQQLSSLYTAFELIDQEHSQEKRSRDELSAALRLADSQVAKAVDHLQRSSSSVNTPATGAPSPPGDIPPIKSNPSYSPSPQHTLLQTGPGAMYAASPKGSGSTTAGITDVIFSGHVMKRGRLNRWKKQHASLCRGFATFQLHLSEPVPSTHESAKKPAVFSLVVFRSSFEVLKGLAKYPYAFRIRIDQYDKNATELVLAVETEGELQQWVAGLQEATNGATSSPRTMTALFPSMTTTPTVITPPRVGSDREGNASSYADDLQTALQVSLRESEQGSGVDSVAEGSRQRVGGAVPENDDTDLEAAIAASLQASAGAHLHGGDFEEAKEEIGHSQSSDAELNEALTQSLLISQRPS